MSAKGCVLTATLAAVLLCAATVSFAQQEPQPAAATVARPAAAAQTAKTATPAQAALPARKRTRRVRPGAGPPHTNVETTEGLEKRAAQTHKPAAATASPTTEPPK
jgi:hypothetical protein